MGKSLDSNWARGSAGDTWSPGVVSKARRLGGKVVRADKKGRAKTYISQDSSDSPQIRWFRAVGFHGFHVGGLLSSEFHLGWVWILVLLAV